MKKKWLAIGIILLFLGTCIIPVAANFTVSNEIKKENFRDSPPKEEWNRTYSHPLGYSCGNCIQITSDGGYVVLGYAGADAWYHFYLLKVDNQGNELWNRTFGSGYIEGNWVEVTSDNGYIITGRVSDNNYHIWLIKTDANGNEEWNKTFGSTFNEWGNCVKQTSDGGYILTGYRIKEQGSFFLIKTDSLGNELWNTTYGNDYAYGNSLAITTDGGYIITGRSSYNLFLMKTDKNGCMEWGREYFNNTYPDSCGKAVQQTSDGGYIVGGYTSSSSLSDFLLMKTDENGIEQWNRTFGSSGTDWGSTVLQTDDGDYILGGTQLGQQDINPDKFWLIRTHPDGSLVWDHFYLPSLSARCYSVQKTLDNGFIATGVINVHSDPKCMILKISGGNHPPSSSAILGPHWSLINNEYLFCINATDPDGDSLYCTWDWGDGNITGWFGPFSNETINASHTWSLKGTFEIRVKLKDCYGHENNWSDPHVFNTGKLKNVFLFGRYKNMTVERDFRVVDAVNLRMILFRPVQCFQYTTGKKIAFLENNSKVFITPRFIIGMVNVVM